jgi:hypothetical protein
LTYADVEVRILKRQGDGYPVEIRVDGEREFPPGRLDAAGPPPAPTDAHYVDDAYGQALFSWFFADAQLKTAWATIRGAHPRRRVRWRIDTDEPALHQVVWEALCEPAEEKQPVLRLASASATPFSRYLASSLPHGRSTLRRPIRILVAAPGPWDWAERYPRDKYPGMAIIEPERELQRLEEALKALIDEDLVTLTLLRPPCSLAAMGQELLRACYHALHVVCHGLYSQATGQAGLILADGQNKVKTELDADIAAMLAQQLVEAGGRGEDSLRLVFLASCETATRSSADAFRGLAPRLVAAGVPAVMAMQAPVGAETARAFAAVFYRQILRHGRVDLAANEARQVVTAAGLPGPVIPVLFLRLRDGLLLAEPGAASPRRRLQAHKPSDYFVGREAEIQRLCQRLTSQPDAAVTVAIWAEGGQGKTELAKKVGQHLEPCFPGGVLWVDVGETADSAARRVAIVNDIARALSGPLDEPLPEK